MITKNQKIRRYCCFYVSDFHLEMILLPVIKNNINKSKIIIFTETNLVDTIKILLERTNFNKEDKNKILNLKYWTNEKFEKLGNKVLEDCIVIINGSKKYIENIENNINKLLCVKIDIVHCYDLNKNKYNISEIKQNYNQVLNTTYGKI